jgi:hypothetical protein
VPPDHDIPVAIIVAVIPSAVQAAIVLIESEAWTAVAVAVIVAVTAYIDTETACACCRGDANGEGRQSDQHVRKLPHCSSPLVVA